MFCRFRQGYNALRLHHSGLADSWKHGTPLRQPSRFKGNPLHEHFASPGSCNGSSQRDLRRSLWQQVCFFLYPHRTMSQCWSVLVSIFDLCVTFKCLVCPVRCPHLFTLSSPSSNAFVYLCCEVDSILLSSDVDDELKRLAGQCCEQIFIADPCRIR